MITDNDILKYDFKKRVRGLMDKYPNTLLRLEQSKNRRRIVNDAVHGLMMIPIYEEELRELRDLAIEVLVSTLDKDQQP